jgi:hypothetical protein
LARQSKKEVRIITDVNFTTKYFIFLGYSKVIEVWIYHSESCTISKLQILLVYITNSRGDVAVI